MRHSSRHTSARISAAFLLSSCLIPCLATVAVAADTAGLQLEEVIVTATKTGETALQSTPLAITAFSGKQLEDRGVTGGKDEMRVGDRALRITGPSEFLTGAELWKPADR